MKTFKTTALTATALCALLSACATTPIYPTSAPAQPVQTPPPPPPPPPPMPPQDNGPLAAPTTPVQSAALPPPPGAMEAPARLPCPPPEPLPPVPRPVVEHMAGSGKVHDDKPEPIKVKKGDTLYSIARKAKISVDDLAKLNDLKKPFRLKLGAEIKLPGKRFYEVETGDTLYSIAHRFGMDASDLADFNKIDADKGLHAGQKLNLPDDAKDKGAPKPMMAAAPRPRSRRMNEACMQVPPQLPPPAAEPPPPPPPIAPSVKPPLVATPIAKPPVAPAPTVPTTESPNLSANDADVAAAGRGLFAWPVRGELINTFGQKGAIRSDGIDIGATQGDSVRSAAAGEVVYAGNAVQGFGNLVLIKHAGGWVTAYAHLASIEVKMRQSVTQGEEIGLVGVSGGVDRPQLHFEIRYAPTATDKARPVDPMLVLPVQ